MRTHLIILFSAFAFLAGCATEVEVPSYADITFKATPPIPLKVARVSSEITYSEPLTAPHVGHEFPVKLAPTAARWAQDRIETIAPTGSAVLTVLEASAVETQLEKSTGVKGLVTDDQAQLYTVKLVVKLAAEDPASLANAEATVSVSRSRSVAEGATFNERERVWYLLTEEVMSDYNKEMEKDV